MKEIKDFIEWACEQETDLGKGFRYSFNSNTNEVIVFTPAGSLSFPVLSFLYSPGISELFKTYKAKQ